MSHHTVRDASGRVISLLHDTDDAPRSYSYSPTTSSVFQGQRGNTSFPNTPDLVRSDSYDSQSSSNEPASPLTPGSAYHEPLFPAAKHSHSTPLHSRTGSRDIPLYHLPPITTIHKVPTPMEATSPRETYHRSSSGHFAPGMTHRDLEDYHYPQSTCHYPYSADSRANLLSPISDLPTNPVVQRSVEQSDAAPRDDAGDEEMVDAGSKKAPKNKSGPQRRYPCKYREICDKTFTTSGHASRHAKIHGGEKTIACSHEGCTKRFTRADNMKQHLETHKKDKSRRPDKLARGPSHGVLKRRQSASTRSSVSRFSTPRDSPPVLSPAFAATGSLVSPGLPTDGWTLSARPSIASRTPSGLDALAMVAAGEQASVEHEEALRQKDQMAAHFSYFQELHLR